MNFLICFLSASSCFSFNFIFVVPVQYKISAKHFSKMKILAKKLALLALKGNLILIYCYKWEFIRASFYRVFRK